jgi:hypothetical protein
MDWILFIFQKGNKHYLVPAGSQDEAWNLLSRRQSMSLERCKKEYSFVCFMNENSSIVKL